MRSNWSDRYAPKALGRSVCSNRCMTIARAAHLQETDCVAGHVRFELRNVVANYPFESSRGFPEIPAKFWPWRLFAFELRRGGNAALVMAVRARTTAKPAIPLLTLRWTLSAKRACVVITDTKLDRLAPFAPPAPMASAGFGWWRRAVAPARSRGVLHVQAQTCAGPQGAVYIQATFEGGPRRDRRP